MTIATLPASHRTHGPRLLSALTASISNVLTALKAHRKRRSDMALLMAMDPQMLRDIGVIVVHTPYDGQPMLGLHPAVLATTMNAGKRAL